MTDSSFVSMDNNLFFKHEEIAEHDHYIYPNGKTLTYSTTSRDGYREYKSDPNNV